jgi:hypothetical protein
MGRSWAADRLSSLHFFRGRQMIGRNSNDPSKGGNGKANA